MLLKTLWMSPRLMPTPVSQSAGPKHSDPCNSRDDAFFVEKPWKFLQKRFHGVKTHDVLFLSKARTKEVINNRRPSWSKTEETGRNSVSEDPVSQKGSTFLQFSQDSMRRVRTSVRIIFFVVERSRKKQKQPQWLCKVL